MGLATSRPASVVPALLRCDGHYQMQTERSNGPVALSLASWCSYLRFEGNGGGVCKPTEAHEQQLRGQWTVVDDATVQLTLPPSERISLPPSILIREGPDIDTVLISVDGMDGSACLVFVPEEHE